MQRDIVAFLVLLGAGLLISGGLQVLDKQRITDVFGRASGDLKTAAQLIHNENGFKRDCSVDWAEPEDVRLARAFVTLESFATTDLERIVERLVVRFLYSLGLPVPDMSLGEGQVKVSTVISETLDQFGDLNPPPSGAIAMRLLEPCPNFEAAVSLVRALSRDAGASKGEAFSRAEVYEIAAGYNGQGKGAGLFGALSHTAYNELVFELYQIYRFEGLAEDSQKNGPGRSGVSPDERF